WGIDTLFKLGAGLDIQQVLLTNAAFTLGSMVFEIPTGVVADTVGRRVSLLLCLVTLFATTLLYVACAWRGWGFGGFMWISVLLGLGYTFYTGAVDAWLVDALKSTGFTGPLEPVFARGQMYFGAAMLVGTIGGGLLGDIRLYIPYLVRAGLVVPLFLLAWFRMPELGFTPRALELRRVGAELRCVLVGGLWPAHELLRRRIAVSAVRRGRRARPAREAGLSERAHPVGPAGDDHLARLDVREQRRRAGTDGVGLGGADAIHRRGVGGERGDAAAGYPAVLAGAAEGPSSGRDGLDAETPG